MWKTAKREISKEEKQHKGNFYNKKSKRCLVVSSWWQVVRGFECIICTKSCTVKYLMNKQMNEQNALIKARYQLLALVDVKSANHADIFFKLIWFLQEEKVSVSLKSRRVWQFGFTWLTIASLKKSEGGQESTELFPLPEEKNSVLV